MSHLLAALTLLSATLVDSVILAQAKSSREALTPLGVLVGEWKGTGIPTGTRDEQAKGFWTETISCAWKFKGDDAWLTLDFDRGKHFASAELRYLPDQEQLQFRVKTTDKKDLAFTGKLKGKVLTLQRHDAGSKEDQKPVLTLLHENRILYRYDVKPAGKGLFYKQYQVGANKEGVAFAPGAGRPECIVSGGLGTMPVSYMGKTYYVCCGGCRDEFRDNPKKYIDEYEANLKKK